MKHLLPLILLTSCVVTPDYENGGEGCWRTGVLENGNTGRMTQTPISELPVIVLSLEDLYAACDLPPPPELAWHNRGKVETMGCYQPKDEKIYILRSARYGYVVEHERCHALLGTAHNSCFGRGYGIGKDIQSACEWDKETAP